MRDAGHRAAALWRAGRDPAVAMPRRMLARIVSAYQRAPVRDLIPLGWFSAAEGAFAALVVRIAVPRGIGRTDGAGTPPDSSGWPGTVLAIGLWLAPWVAIAVASRVWR